MIAEPLARALEATGYLAEGRPAAPTVALAGMGTPPRLPALKPDAWWRREPMRGANGAWEPAHLTVLFKFAENPAPPAVADWHRDAWNMGCVPLLWVVSPDRTDIYNAFGQPRTAGSEGENLVRTFGHSAAELSELSDFAGRLAMETGEFWKGRHRLDRGSCVDRLLLRDLAALERDLVGAGLDRGETQALVGRTVFAKYLLDRGIAAERRLRDICGHGDLPQVLGDRDATGRLFGWLRDTFNGDMFPATLGAPPAAEHLARVASFLRADAPDGQMSLFPYRFDVIPVELISSIYERFVHSSGVADSTAPHSQHDTAGAGAEPASPRAQGVYYTPLPAVSLVLDEVFNGLSGDETVIDLTCGSGVFLVEALRRLVRLKAGRGSPTREMVRKALYEQVYGVDVSPAAIRIAAFSLYLAALELDPDPGDPTSIKFEPLVGRTLLAGDAHKIKGTEAGRRVLAANGTPRQFDVVVGNPPWTYRGKVRTAARRGRNGAGAVSPRGEGLDFVRRGMDFAHSRTRFGVLLSAAQFFPRSATGLQAVQDTVELLAPVTLISLSDASSWLFDKANMPAMVLLARHRESRSTAMELFRVMRSYEGDRSNSLTVARSARLTLPPASWKRNPGLLKAGFVGVKHDLVMLDSLFRRYAPLKDELARIGVKWASGLIVGDRSRDAGFLTGLRLASAGAIGHFAMREGLPKFEESSAQWPRERDIYRAPLLLMGEYMRGGRAGVGNGRAATVVAERDTVYSDTHFGASFAGAGPDIAYLVAGILSSSLASWYFLMAGSNFGVWQRNLRLADVVSMPAPDLAAAAKTDAGASVVRLVRRLHARPPTTQDWSALDDAVFDLYKLHGGDRIVGGDGRRRATWQWKAAREAAAVAAGHQDLRDYALGFLASMDPWFHAANERRFRAELFDTGAAAPVRVVSFALEDQPPPSRLVERDDLTLRKLIADIDARLDVAVAEDMAGVMGLRVHSPREIVIIKPAARRYWLGIDGLDDARAVLAASFGAGAG